MEDNETNVNLDDVATPDPEPVDENTESADESPQTVNLFEGEKKSLTDVAQEVAAGKWGEGQARRSALADAGYDPNEVQQEIIRLRNEKP